MDRFKANKFGVINFWYYDEEEFTLADGKILFRGTNGSGKSVTTQSFIPLLLDGDKRPERLDPFGSKSRKMEEYILVSPEDDERISYLYIEFYKQSTESYVTIGMGLRGRRGHSVDSWYFILKDGRRIGKDFMLYNNSSEKFPLTSRQLKNKLGEGNIFTDSQKEYMAKVNENLFGFSDLNNYKELLNLMIQLRSPKLSKDFKPTVIYEILKQSLSTLADDDLHQISDAMENMTTLDDKIKATILSIEAVQKIEKAFRKYNKAILSAKISDYKAKSNDVLTIQEKLDKHKEKKKQLELTITKDTENKESKQIELNKAEQKKEILSNHEGFELIQEIGKSENRIKEIVHKLEVEETALQNKKNQENSLNKEIDTIEAEVYNLEKDYDNYIDEEADCREQIYYYHIENIRDALKNDDREIFSRLDTGIRNYNNLLNEIYNHIYDLERTTEEKEKIDKKKSQAEIQLESAISKCNEVTEYLTTIKDEYNDGVKVYLAKSQQLRLDDDQLLVLFKLVNDIVEKNDCCNILDVLIKFKNNLNLVLEQEKVSNTQQVCIVQSNIENITQKIKELENSKATFDEEYIAYKNTLDDNNIPYIELYKCITFKEDVDEQSRINIEASLKTMGILTSLVIPRAYRTSAAKIIDEHAIINLDKSNRVQNNIAHLFELENIDFNKEYGQEVIEILRSIGIKDNLCIDDIEKETSTAIDLKGNYSIGILTGRVNNEYSLKYIGTNSREQYRKMRLAELEKNKEKFEQDKSILKAKIDEIDAKLKKLEEEFEYFPCLDDIKVTIDEIEKANQLVEKISRQNNSLEIRQDDLKKKIININAAIIDKSNGVKIPNKTASYQEVFNGIKDYQTILNNLRDIFKDIKYKQKSQDDNKRYLKGIEEDISKIEDVIYDLRKEKKTVESEIAAREESLKAFDMGAVENELKLINAIVDEYPQKIKKLESSIIQATTNIEFLETQITEEEQEIYKKKQVLEVAKVIANKEIQLGYVNEVKEKTLEDIIHLNFEELLGENRNISKLQEELSNVFAENKGYIAEYNIKSESRFNLDELIDNTILASAINSDEYNKSLLEAEFRNSIISRTDIICRYEGRNNTLYALIERLNKNLYAQQTIINQQEREIFEDILINTLSSKIKAKIYTTKQWIKQINEMMEGLETSSGFKLHLRWIPKKAANDNELDIKKLLDLLTAPNLMLEEEKENIGSHFKEKLKQARRVVDKEGRTKSYHVLMKEILDYREWYEFQLQFVKSHSATNRKELTDNEFFKLSGGEKAMAMYIPLFVAINVRYKESDRLDAPKIISLDEAFAGVDESNINSMFGLLEQLKLDYVMNSQVLWGTYESVKNLAIYELFREDEVVTSISFRWDGKVKHCIV